MSDLDYYDALNGPYVTCRCVECDADFREPFDAPQTLCVECAEARDVHTTALETRLTDVAVTMVKAALARKEEVA